MFAGTFRKGLEITVKTMKLRRYRSTKICGDGVEEMLK